MKKLLVVFFALTVLACSDQPEPISYGEDECANCMMLITQPQYGSELITDKGKIYKFDSIECLASYTAEADAASMWVTDFNKPHALIDIKGAYFLRADNLRSPMGLSLSAYSNQSDLEKNKSKHGGEHLSWDELVEYVKNEWN